MLGFLVVTVIGLGHESDPPSEQGRGDNTPIVSLLTQWAFRSAMLAAVPPVRLTVRFKPADVPSEPPAVIITVS